MARPNMPNRMIVHYVNYDVDSNLQSDANMPTSDVGRIVETVNKIKDVNGYVAVAKIEYDDRQNILHNLENAYRIMQNGVVTDSWTLAPPDGLTALVDPIKHPEGDMGHRSMSMGDIVEYGGSQYVVAAFGFFDLRKNSFMR